MRVVEIGTYRQCSHAVSRKEMETFHCNAGVKLKNRLAHSFHFTPSVSFLPLHFINMALYGSTMYTAVIACLLTIAFGKEGKISKHAANLASHSLPSSCRGLEDGYHYLKLMEDTDDTTYPIVYAQCSNEYVVIDYNADDSWSDYFTTWVKYHYAVCLYMSMSAI